MFKTSSSSRLRTVCLYVSRSSDGVIHKEYSDRPLCFKDNSPASEANAIRPNPSPHSSLPLLFPNNHHPAHNFALTLNPSSTPFTPALATSSSCAGVPVLHPIAPTTTPSCTIGTPPAIVMNLPPLLLLMPNAAPPGHTASLYTDVGARWPAAVKALSIAMEMEVSFAPGRRVKERRWRVESTMAMFWCWG